MVSNTDYDLHTFVIVMVYSSRLGSWVLGRVFYKHRKLILAPGSSHEALAPEALRCSSKESIANEGRTKSG